LIDSIIGFVGFSKNPLSTTLSGTYKTQQKWDAANSQTKPETIILYTSVCAHGRNSNFFSNVASVSLISMSAKRIPMQFLKIHIRALRVSGSHKRTVDRSQRADMLTGFASLFLRR